LSEITGSSGWELALVTAQPSSSNQLAESKLVKNIAAASPLFFLASIPLSKHPLPPFAPFTSLALVIL